MVGPTNLKPLFLSSLLIAVDSSVSAGMFVKVFRLWLLVFPFTNFQMYVSKLPCSFCTSRNRWALLIVACIFALFRIISALFMRRLTSFCVYLAIFSGLKLSKAFLNASRRLRMSSHVKPAWKPSSMRNSKSVLSSWTGVPHSSS